MTREDFELIAEVLASLDDRHQHAVVTGRFVAALVKAEPGFNVDIFTKRVAQLRSKRVTPEVSNG